MCGYIFVHVYTGDCRSETTLISVKLCTLNVVCMVAMIDETVDDVDVHMRREVADVVDDILGRVQVEQVRVVVTKMRLGKKIKQKEIEWKQVVE